MQFNFNRHKELEGLHAPYGPSQSSWLRYDDAKVVEAYTTKKATEMGTILHAWAKTTIDLRIKQPKSKKTLYAYVNDAIGYDMNTEVILFYSNNCFGTADAISFKKQPNGRFILRIHDLKTGEEKASMEQLEVYAALFCLEYKFKPGDIDFELRIYQNDEVLYHRPTAEDILPIMDVITYREKILNRIDCEED